MIHIYMYALYGICIHTWIIWTITPVHKDPKQQSETRNTQLCSSLPIFHDFQVVIHLYSFILIY